MPCFVSGHDFSRAVTSDNMSGFSPCLSYPFPKFSAPEVCSSSCHADSKARETLTTYYTAEAVPFRDE
jgi:hypothetical protein